MDGGANYGAAETSYAAAETSYAADTVGDGDAIVDWDKQADFGANADEETALHLAIKNRDHFVLHVLFAATDTLASRSINYVDDFVWHPNKDKDTALHLALNNHDPAYAEQLLKVTPPPYERDLRNNLGKTPVYLAVKFGYNRLVNMMCKSWKYFLSLDGPDDSSTVLHAAISKLHKAMH
ncbi:hypothetical protein AgCh_035267 [Apium graveolens]